MEMTLTCKLTRPAMGKGGDRYESPLKGEDKPFVIYIPQTISRKEGVPAMMIDVTFEDGR